MTTLKRSFLFKFKSSTTKRQQISWGRIKQENKRRGCSDDFYSSQLNVLEPWICAVRTWTSPPSRFISERTDRWSQQTDRWSQQTDGCHVGVYLSTTTGRNTSTAEPGQGPWIWLGQAAIWMATEERGDKKKINQPANQPKTNMEDGAATARRRRIKEEGGFLQV